MMKAKGSRVVSTQRLEKPDRKNHSSTKCAGGLSCEIRTSDSPRTFASLTPGCGLEGENYDKSKINTKFPALLCADIVNYKR